MKDSNLHVMIFPSKYDILFRYINLHLLILKQCLRAVSVPKLMAYPLRWHTFTIWKSWKPCCIFLVMLRSQFQLKSMTYSWREFTLFKSVRMSEVRTKLASLLAERCHATWLLMWLRTFFSLEWILLLFINYKFHANLLPSYFHMTNIHYRVLWFLLIFYGLESKIEKVCLKWELLLLISVFVLCFARALGWVWGWWYFIFTLCITFFWPSQQFQFLALINLKYN